MLQRPDDGKAALVLLYSSSLKGPGRQEEILKNLLRPQTKSFAYWFQDPDFCIWRIVFKPLPEALHKIHAPVRRNKNVKPFGFEGILPADGGKADRRYNAKKCKEWRFLGFWPRMVVQRLLSWNLLVYIPSFGR